MFQGVQSPWLRPSTSDRSPDDRSSLASAERSGPRAWASCGRAVTRSASCNRYELDENVARSRPPSVATSKTTSELGAFPDRPQYRCGKGDITVIAISFQTPSYRSCGTDNDRGEAKDHAFNAAASFCTSARVSGFHPSFAYASTAPSGLMIWRTGFRFGRNCLPIDTATSTRGTPRMSGSNEPTRSMAGATWGPERTTNRSRERVAPPPDPIKAPTASFRVRPNNDIASLNW